MKLLHVISTMDPRSGGPCQGIRNLEPQVTGQGHTVEVVCLDDPNAAYLAKETVRVHALGQGRGPWAYHPRLLPWLRQNLSRFDAVILNGLWQYPGYALSQAAKNPNCPPYFVFPHGMLDPWFQRAPERRLKAIRNWCYWKLIEQRVISRAGALLFTCAEELRLARETFSPYQPKREINVGYGVSEPPAYHERMAAAFAEKCPSLNSRPYLLFLSRIHPKKGIDLLIRAYATVYGSRERAGSQSLTSDQKLTGVRGPWSVVHGPIAPALVIAGPGLDTPYGQEMQRLAAEVSGPWSAVSGSVSDLRPQSSVPSPHWGAGQGEVSSSTSAQDQKSVVRGPRTSDPRSLTSDLRPLPSILWPGMLTGDAKWGALYGSEAFILPSHQENFGIAVVESLACGRPVLISNQINIHREISEDNAGLVEPDTIEGTVRLLQRWESLKLEERLAMRRNARINFEDRFSIAFAAKKLLAALEKGISSSKRRPPASPWPAK